MAKFKLFGRNFSFRDSIGNPSKWLVLAFGGGTDTATGIRVNEVVALKNLTIMACVKVISETLAQLPLPIYQRMPDGSKQRVPMHPLYRILDRMPNDRMTSFTFKETLMAHLLTWGNAYMFIERDNAGRVRSLYPLLPDRTWPKVDAEGNLIYVTRIKKDPQSVSAFDGAQLTLSADQVLHIPGLGFDGMKGYSVISQAREAIGLGLALEEYAARFFGNGAVPGLVFQTDQNLGPEQRKALEAAWQEGHQGLVNAQRIAILEQGLKVEKIGIPPEDAQFLESRKFSRNELAGIFRVPPHMIGDIERTTSWGTGIEQQAIGFVVYTMLPWLERWQQAINTKLFLPSEQDRLFCEFVVDGLVRGDITARYGAYNLAFGKWLTANDIRRKENETPWDDAVGELRFAPSGMMPLADDGSIIVPTNPNAEPAPADESQPSADPGLNPADSGRSFGWVRRWLLDALTRDLARQRADAGRGRAGDNTLLERSLVPIVETMQDAGYADAPTWAENVVNHYLATNVRLLGDGGPIGIEAAFGATGRVERETERAMGLLPASLPPSAPVDPMVLALRAFAERSEPTINITNPPVTVTIAEGAIKTEVVIPEREINITNPIAVTTPDVLVTNEAAAAPIVNVQAEFKAPDTEQQVIYDKQGRVAGTRTKSLPAST